MWILKAGLDRVCGVCSSVAFWAINAPLSQFNSGTSQVKSSFHQEKVQMWRKKFCGSVSLLLGRLQHVASGITSMCFTTICLHLLDQYCNYVVFIHSPCFCCFFYTVKHHLLAGPTLHSIFVLCSLVEVPWFSLFFVHAVLKIFKYKKGKKIMMCWWNYLQIRIGLHYI